MYATLPLLQHSARITLFTRVNCSLCASAKAVLAAVEKRRSFEYNEVDVMAEGNESARKYEFDVPVVSDSAVGVGRWAIEEGFMERWG